MLKFTNMVPNWDGSPWDANQYSAVEIWCFVAPTTPYTIKTGEKDGKTVTTTADYDSGTGITQTSTISAVGRYFVPGNGYVSITGGTGGNFSINATQSTLPTTRAGQGATIVNGALEVQPVQGAITNMTLVSGLPIAVDLRTYSGAKIQIIGLNTDTLLVEQSTDGTAWVTAYLMKSDTSAPFAATAMTGAANNGIYSVYGFAGELRFTRTNSADTLTVKVKGTN